MPIRGLTDRAAAFPELGQVRKGAPKPPQGNRPGEDLRWFRVIFDEREEEAAAAFTRHYGAEPAELDVLLPFSTAAENFEAWREAYLAGGLIHRCDGERVLYEVDPATGERTVVQGLPEKRCDGSRPVAHYAGKDGKREAVYCRAVGRLKVLIPQLQRLAYLTVLTSSLHDIMNLSRQLDALYRITGNLAGIPLKLRRRPIKVSTPGEGGKRVRREKWLLSIEADPAWVKAKLQAMRAAALPGNGLDNGDELPVLEVPVEHDEDEEPQEAGHDAAQQPPQADAPLAWPLAPTASDNPVGADPATRYWWTVRLVGLDRDAGVAILRECQNDFKVARRKLELQYSRR